MMQQMLHTICYINQLYNRRYGCLLFIIIGGIGGPVPRVPNEKTTASIFSFQAIVLKGELRAWMHLLARMSTLFCLLVGYALSSLCSLFY